MCPFPSARVLLTIQLPQSGPYHHPSAVLAAEPCQTIMSIGTGDGGCPRMLMHEARVAVVKRERPLRPPILILIPQTLRLEEELVF